MKIVFICSVLLLLISIEGFSQQQTPSKEYDRYASQTLYMIGNNKFVVNNTLYSGHTKLTKAFSMSPNGMDLYMRSRKNRNIAFALSLVGAIGTIYSLTNRDNTKPFIWLSLGTGLISAPLTTHANNQLNRAVWIRNHDALTNTDERLDY